MNLIGIQRAITIVKLVTPHLKQQDTLLDIGAGSCRLAAYIAKKTKINVTPLDVVDNNITSMKLVTYDGEALPYDDNSFDAVSLIFVLHHAENESKLLEEAKRVARNKVIIVEDTPKGRIEKQLWQRIDYGMNHAKHENIAVAHSTKNVEEWNAVFISKGLKLITVTTFRRFFLSGWQYRHSIFVLKK